MATTNTTKKLLLICYSFPPFQGIGGRRWAKFIKYLSRRGYEVYVIGAHNQGSGVSSWMKDVRDIPGLRYYSVKTKYYHFFHDFKSTLANKISFQVSKTWLKLRYRGNFYDKALPSNHLFYQKACELIQKHDIKNLVVTIAPNRLAEVGTKLKGRFPNLNFILDVRDPWNICNDEWDHKFLSEKRKDYEIKVENEAILSSDYILSVADFISQHYKLAFPKKANKIFTVTNGYDQDEISTISYEDAKPKTGSKDIVFTGTLYDNVTEHFEEFVKSLLDIAKTSPGLLENVNFKFYMPRLAVFEEISTKYKCDLITFFDTVPVSEVQKIIGGAYACMLFLPPQYEFSLSTKFFEYVSQGKKIIIFSQPGDTPNLIESYNLGYVISPGTMTNNLTFALTELQEGKAFEKNNFNISDFSIVNIAEKITSYIK